MKSIIGTNIFILEANQQGIEVDIRGHFGNSMILCPEDQFSKVILEDYLDLNSGASNGSEANREKKPSFSQPTPGDKKIFQTDHSSREDLTKQ